MLLQLFTRFTAFSGLIPIAVVVIPVCKLDKPLKIAFWFVAVSFLLNMVNLYCSAHHIHNLAVFHLYAIFEFGLVLGFFSYFVKGALKKAIIPMVSLFAVWCIINFFFIQKGLQLNTYTRPVDAMIIVIYCISYFNRETHLNSTYQWEESSHNWVALAFLVFYGCTFFMLVSSNYFLTYGDKSSLYFWKIYDAFVLAENVLLAIGFYKARRIYVMPLST